MKLFGQLQAFLRLQTRLKSILVRANKLRARATNHSLVKHKNLPRNNLLFFFATKIKKFRKKSK